MHSWHAQVACTTLQQHMDRLHAIALDDMCVFELQTLQRTIDCDLGKLDALFMTKQRRQQRLQQRLADACKRRETCEAVTDNGAVESGVP